jgi:tape measure domain-containing protein
MADLTLTIDAKTLAGVGESFRQLERNLSALRRQLEQTASASNVSGQSLRARLSAVGAAFDQITAKAARFGTVITGALGGAAAALLRAGSQAIATEKAFTTLLGSSVRAQRLIEAINREAAQSVLQFSDMLVAAQRLLAAGIRESDILPTIRAIGDALAASGDVSRENALAIVKAFSDIASKGKLQAQEMIQLTNANVPVLKILREELKMTSEQFAEFMQGKRAVGAGEALRALVRGLQREFGGLQKQMMETPLGQISNLWDNLTRVLRSAGTPLARAIVPALKEMNAQISRLVESGQLAKLAPLLTELARQGGAALNALLAVLVKIGEIFSAMPRWAQSAFAAFVLLLGPGSLVLRGAVGLYNHLRGIVGLMGALVVRIYQAVAGMRLLNATAVGGAGVGRVAAGGLGVLGRVAGVAGALLATMGSASAQELSLEQRVAQELRAQVPVVRTPWGRFPLVPGGAGFQLQVEAEARRLAPVVAQLARERGLEGVPQSALPELIQAARERLREVAPPRVELPSAELFANLPDLSDLSDRSDVARRAREGRERARARAGLELARQVALLPVPGISALIDAGRLEEARRRVAGLRAELVRLAQEAARLRIQEEEEALGRRLSRREREAVAELTRREMLADVEQLENQIERALEAQNRERERALAMERERKAQLLREIHELSVQLQRLQLQGLPVEEQLKRLPAVHRRELLPVMSELAMGVMALDPLAMRRALAALAVQREQQAQELQRLQEQVAQQQVERARRLMEAREQALAVERQLVEARRYAAIVLADAEIQNAQRQLQILQQQGASREMVRGQELLILQATERKLRLEEESLEAALQQLEVDRARLVVQVQLLSVLGEASLQQRAALMGQVAQLERQAADVAARLAVLRGELRLIKQVGDENNPFRLWQVTLQYAIQQLSRDLADAILGFRRLGDSLKQFFQNLARDFLAILLRELLNPLYIALQAFAQRLAAAIFQAFGVGQAAAASAAGAAGAGGAAAGLGALGGALGAAGLAFAVAPALGLNQTGAAVGAGIGFLVGGPIGGLFGGLVGGLFGGRRRESSPPPVQFVPLAGGRTVITNDIHLRLDGREISRAIVTNAY